MIAVTGVSMRFGSRILFEDVTTTFQAGRRYGLTGPNGSGQSTFMKLLTGETPTQVGTVARPPGGLARGTVRAREDSERAAEEERRPLANAAREGIGDPHQLEMMISLAVGRWSHRAFRRSPLMITIVIDA